MGAGEGAADGDEDIMSVQWADRQGRRTVDLDAMKEAFDLREMIHSEREKRVNGGEKKMVVCPFHDDHEPSLQVGRAYYHCFGCGAWGSVFDWVMFSERCSFGEAVRWCEERVGTLPVRTGERDVGLPEEEPFAEMGPLGDEWVERVAKWQSELFDCGKVAMLEDKWGIRPETAFFFRLGYDGDHFVIPVYDAEDRLVTVRFKSDTSIPGTKKRYWGIKGRNANFLYNAWSLRNGIGWGTVQGTEKPGAAPTEAHVLFGELKAIADQQINADLGRSVACVAVAGQNAWSSHFNKMLGGCGKVVIFPDVGEWMQGVSVLENFVGKGYLAHLKASYVWQMSHAENGKRSDRNYDISDWLLENGVEAYPKLLASATKYGEVYSYYSVNGNGVPRWESI